MSNDANKLRQRQEIRKYLVFAGMFLLFVGCMWLIFAPSKEERQREERNAGFNSELPDPRGAGIEADKIAAYEQADMKRRQEEKMRTLEDFSALADENRQNETSSPVVEIPQERESESASSYRGSGNRRNGAISSSTSAYNDINATLGSFYEAPREDPEKEALKAEVEQLKQAAAVQQRTDDLRGAGSIAGKILRTGRQIYAGQGWRRYGKTGRNRTCRQRQEGKSRSRGTGLHTGGVIASATRQ